MSTPSLGHGANDIMGSEGFTRLEAAELERRNLITAELDKHRDNLDAELSRHRREMAHITRVFGQRLSVA